jgi:regulator of sirC expression with transglutaminase-like and TPR domain
MNQPDNKGPGAEGFRQEFARAITRPEEDLDLGRAALLIAGEEYPDLDVPKYLQLLDRYAAAVQERAPHTLPPEERAIQLGAYLFGELGFHGNSSDYYNPENSYFNRVLETKSGIPISLSLLFIEVGRRIGLRLHGIGMPGHFLVGLEGRGAFFDPFNGGEALSSADCRQLAERLFGERLTWDDQYLEPCTKYEFLFRILNNLKVVYERTDAPQGRWCGPTHDNGEAGRDDPVPGYGCVAARYAAVPGGHGQPGELPERKAGSSGRTTGQGLDQFASHDPESIELIWRH